MPNKKKKENKEIHEEHCSCGCEHDHMHDECGCDCCGDSYDEIVFYNEDTKQEEKFGILWQLDEYKDTGKSYVALAPIDELEIGGPLSIYIAEVEYLDDETENITMLSDDDPIGSEIYKIFEEDLKIQQEELDTPVDSEN